MPSCPHCGYSSPHPGVAFCARCGRALQAPQTPKTQRVRSAQLTIRWPGGRAVPVPLGQDVITLGREKGNTVLVDCETVSRQHARLERRNDVYHFIDLGSKNGTTLNGQRLLPNTAYPLAHGAVLRIGDMAGNWVSLTFEEGAGPAAQAVARGLDLRGRASATLGRDPQADVPLPAPTVSWHHARIDQAGARAVLRDLGSRNGTFVNGKQVTVQPLSPGDRIQIGPFLLTYQTAALSQAGGAHDFRLDGMKLRREVPDRENKGATRLILNDVSISVAPREFVALVGGSGAGKSTLMNALSGFRPADAGHVLVNCDDLYQNYGAYQTQMGYVPQDDIIHLALPVSHALRYAARLRLPPDTTAAEVEKRIHDVLASVGMAGQKDQVVSSLSGGQRKRVNIGLELLAEPGLFFLDEPTSGLDPGLEKRMMGTLRQLSDEGRTIILVTHATANIAQCDLVAFLAQGRLVFYGPPDEAKSFFKVAEFADIYTLLEPPPTPQDPRPDLPKIAGDWETYYRSHPCYRQYVEQRQSSLRQPGGAPPARPVRASSPLAPLRQLRILATRYFELIIRDRMSLIVLLLVMPLIGFLLALIANPLDLVGESEAAIGRLLQAEGRYSVAGRSQTVVMMTALAVVLLGLFAAAYELIKERPIYRRERMVNLGIVPYLLSKVGVLFAFSWVQCLALLFVLSLKVDLPEQGLIFSAPVEMYLTLILAALASISLGLFISAAVRTQNMVIYLVLLVLFLQIIFAGVLFEVPKATKPLSYVTITRWAQEGLGATVNMDRLNSLGKTLIKETVDVEVEVPDPRGNPHRETVTKEVSIENPLAVTFQVDYTRSRGHLVSRWAVLVGFTGVLLVLTAVLLRRQDEIKG